MCSEIHWQLKYQRENERKGRVNDIKMVETETKVKEKKSSMKDGRWIMVAEYKWNYRFPLEILIKERPHSSQTQSNIAFFFFPGSASGKQCNVGKLTFKVTHNPFKKLSHPQNTASDITFSSSSKLHVLTKIAFLHNG